MYIAFLHSVNIQPLVKDVHCISYNRSIGGGGGGWMCLILRIDFSLVYIKKKKSVYNAQNVFTLTSLSTRLAKGLFHEMLQ